MILSLQVEDIPPSNNRFIGRNNKWEYQALKKEWFTKIAEAVPVIPSEPFEKAEITISYTFPDRRRRDPDNYSGKMILDPLTRLGIIRDDDFKHIDLKVSGRYEKGVRRTEIKIVEVSK